VLLRNTQSGETQTSDVFVRLNGLDDDTTVNDLVAQLDGINGLTASLNSRGQLELRTESSKIEFAFGNDTSGVLAALGLGTFFTGATAGTLGVNAAVKADPSKFTASSGGIGEDTRNAERLASFLDQPLDSAGGETIANVYDRLTSGVIQGSAISHSVADGYRVFEQSLSAQNLAISGVNLDEEAIKLLGFQRLFQASAKVIATVNDLLDILVAL
jgi:flagellar hook-associated protein 1 FlgK